jgi:phosphatidylglycerophosphatase A
MSPVMPGTMGSLATGLLLYAVYRFGWNYPAWQGILVAGILIFSTLSVALGPWAIRFYERKDPGAFVLDECAGVCVTLLALPMNRPIWAFVVAVLAFRVFDMVKPPPVRYLERLPAGWGILCDDLAAGVLANLVSQAVLRWILP